MSARVCISTEEGLVLELGLGSRPLRIGRAKDNTLRSEDRRTSRHHAAILRQPDGSYAVEDLGSSYGTLLNGKPVRKETLKHQDILRCGAIAIQYLADHGPDDDVPDPSIMTATLDNLFEARQRIRQLIEEQAALRSEVGIAQEAEDRAKRMRDEAQDEVERLHGQLDAQRKENALLDEKLEELGKELREALAKKNAAEPEVEALRQRLAEANKQLEQRKARIAELEERDHGRLTGEQTAKKDLDRLTEQLKKREQREAELMAAMKPALMRIAELSKELELAHLKLATAEADLAERRR